MRMRARAWFVGGLIGLLVAAGCRPKARDLPVCDALVAAPSAEESDTRTLPFDVWLSLLIRDFERTTLTVPDQPRDCAYRPISNEAAGFEADDVGLRAALSEGDLAFGLDPTGRLIVWAKILTMPGGDALGPVALAQWVEKGLEIRGIGTLRAPAKRTKLYIEPLDAGTSVLFAEGDACPDGPEALASCERALQLALLAEQRFSPLQVQEGEAAPVAARVALSGLREEKGAGGELVRTSLQRKVKVVDGELVMSESIRVERCVRGGEACELDARHEEPRVLTRSGSILKTGQGAWFKLDAKTR